MRKPTLEDLDHPLPFVLALALVLIPIFAFAGWGLAKLNLPGPSGLFVGAANN